MQMYTGYWVALPQEVRSKMVTYFAIQRSSGTHVEAGRIISDGHTDADLLAITLEKLQRLLGSKEENFSKLLEQAIQHFKDEVAAENKDNLKKANEEFEAVKSDEIKTATEIVEKVAQEVVKRRGPKPKIKTN